MCKCFVYTIDNMDNATFLKTYISEYQKKVLGEEFDQDVEYYNIIKKEMHRMTIHHPQIMSELLDPNNKNHSKTHKIIENSGTKNVVDTIATIKKLFIIIKSINLEQIRESRNQMYLLTQNMQWNLNNVTTINNIDERIPTLMTFLQPKLDYWLHYTQTYILSKNPRDPLIKIIKYIKKKYNESNETMNDFINDNSRLLELITSLTESDNNMNQSLNIHIAESERKRIIQYTGNHGDSEFTNQNMMNIINREITDQNMAFNFMCMYNDLIHRHCIDLDKLKQQGFDFPSNLRLISSLNNVRAKTDSQYPEYDTNEQQILFKKITKIEKQRLRMLTNLATKINSNNMKELLLAGTSEIILPDYLNKKTINQYHKLCGSLPGGKNNVLINNLQSIIKEDDVFDLTHDFGVGDGCQWIIEELMCLNHEILQII